MPEGSDNKRSKDSRIEDEKVFENIFRYYYKGLCAYAYTFLKDRDASEEVVQAFFTDLWETQVFLEVEISLKLYLYRSVHNRCINYLKTMAVSQRRFEKYARHTQDEIELINMDTESEMYEHFFSDDFESEIQKAIDDLAPQQRHIFILSRFRQKSYTDIADELKISVNSVKTQMSRALRKLRSTLVAKIGGCRLLILLLLSKEAGLMQPVPIALPGSPGK